VILHSKNASHQSLSANLPHPFTIQPAAARSFSQPSVSIIVAQEVNNGKNGSQRLNSSQLYMTKK
jgi:hypothetical protein